MIETSPAQLGGCRLRWAFYSSSVSGKITGHQVDFESGSYPSDAFRNLLMAQDDPAPGEIARSFRKFTSGSISVRSSAAHSSRDSFDFRPR